MEGVKKVAKIQPDFSQSSATIQAQNAKFRGNNWRRGRDLNSRIGYPISGFQDLLKIKLGIRKVVTRPTKALMNAENGV